MKIKTVLLFFCICLNCSSELETSVLIEDFNWKEYSTANNLLLEESGYRYGVKLTYSNLKSKIISSKVNYDGQRWNGESVTTKTDYFSFNIEYDKTYKILLYGLGFDVWSRELGNNNKSIGGHTEYWFMNYIKAGILYKNLNVNFNIPYYCRNNVHGVSLKPEPKPFYDLNLNFNYNNLILGFNYKVIHFDESDDITHSYYKIYQPHSDYDSKSIYIGLKF